MRAFLPFALLAWMWTLSATPQHPASRRLRDSPQKAEPDIAQPTQLPVTRVSLYKKGVGIFEHAGRVSGDQRVTLDLTSAQRNDVLQLSQPSISTTAAPPVRCTTLRRLWNSNCVPCRFRSGNDLRNRRCKMRFEERALRSPDRVQPSPAASFPARLAQCPTKGRLQQEHAAAEAELSTRSSPSVSGTKAEV